MVSEIVPRWGTKRRCLSGLNMWNEDSYSACILSGAGRELAVNQGWGGVGWGRERTYFCNFDGSLRDDRGIFGQNTFERTRGCTTD